MSIARRESAFFPQARSPVGARGLMQIMPATGKQVARGLGQNHRSSQLYEVEHNVLLGSAYYRELLDRYQGNRIFALAAYNAGPHRVDRWKRPGTQALDVEAWVETIPFRETRNYVQAVLSYNVVFNYLQGKQTPVLSDLERRGSY
jgi:soluble lytic murein transglycosylase